MKGDIDQFLGHFRMVQDPRIERRKLHKLESILFIAVCGVLSGVENWVEMEEFAEARKDWFAKYVDLRNGIPSHDTLARVFAQLDPKEFEKGFFSWIQSVYQKTQGEVIAIDGKTIRRSHDKRKGQGPLHLVEAWAAANHLVLAQVKSAGAAGTEIEAMMELLGLLDVKKCIVTMDAMGCHQEMAERIQDRGGDYVLALKANQGILHEEVKTYWEDPKLPKAEYDEYETVEKGHGRIEARRCRMSSQIEWMEDRWPGLHSIGMVESKRTIGESTTTERRYYLTSLPPNAKELAKAIRAHWEIENKVHWCLDVSFREDHSRARVKHAAQNLALLRRLTLNILRKDTRSKRSLNIKRRLASWKPEYLEYLLSLN